MKIACLLESWFEDAEFKEPYDAFTAAGHQVTVIGLEAGKAVTGERGEVRVRTERSLDDADPGEFDALFMPGGYSPDRLRADERAVTFVRAMVESGKPTFAICHGPQPLITAEVVRGRRMTAWPTIQGDLQKVGAIVVDQEVVVDGNLVTSRKPDDIQAFVREALKMLSHAQAVGVRNR